MDPLNIKLLSEFLSRNARQDVKLIALQELLGLTGSGDGCKSIEEDEEIGRSLIDCLVDENEIISKTTCLSLVNISATESGANYLISVNSGSHKEIIVQLLKHVLNPNSCTADAACMTLSNLSRHCSIATLVVDHMVKADVKVDDIINAFVNINYNSKGCNLNYLGPLFSNLTQSVEFRRQLMNKSKCLLQKLLPFTQFHASLIRKGGVVGALRNCCFETECHEWLLGSQVDILSHLLLPLAGPEEFDEEDNDKLPVDLQYLGEDKKREADADIRKMLLEALNQLCATKFGREFLRNNNVYIILREYHKWEKDRSILLVCENIVDLLIRTEEEINEDNLKELQVPEKYVEKFEKMDKNYIEDE